MSRNYRKEYDTYHGKPDQIKNRAQRNSARSEKAKTTDVSGKEVHHKNAIRHGGSNASSNLSVTSASKNKGWRKGKTGYD